MTVRFRPETTASRTTTNQRLASRDRQTQASVHAHQYCDEIRAGGDVTQTDPAVALRRPFDSASMRAFNERLRICREAQRESCAAGRRRRTVRTSAGLGRVIEGIDISIARTSRQCVARPSTAARTTTNYGLRHAAGKRRRELARTEFATRVEPVAT